MTSLLDRLGIRLPIIAAPMGGGPSTPALVAAVGETGGLGFLAAGYRTAEQTRDQVRETRARTDRPFGVNVFVPGAPEADRAALDAYRDRLAPVAARLGVAVGQARWDDDAYAGKLDVVVEERVPVVSFTFGCPSADDVARLHAVGATVVVTVTTPHEAGLARESGADAVCAQGAEAGAHRGSFEDDPSVPPGADALGLLPLLGLLSGRQPLPVVAAGGLMTGRDVAAVLAAGAEAAQLGTAFLCCAEAGTGATHRRVLLDRRYPTTRFTRAFTGRTARGLANPFLLDHQDAPAGYPWVHHMTRPLRTAAAEHGDPAALHLWAGQGWPLVRELPAAELVAQLVDELAAARRDVG